MAAETIQLTYRELADRLGVSPDGARMRAKRAAQAGRWRIIKGNHPSDPVRVEIPAADLQGPKPKAIVRGGPDGGRTTGGTRGDHVGIALQAAQARIEALTDQLSAEKDQHRATAVDLARAEAKVEAMVIELARLEAIADELRQDLDAERRTWWQRLTGR